MKMSYEGYTSLTIKHAPNLVGYTHYTPLFEVSFTYLVTVGTTAADPPLRVLVEKSRCVVFDPLVLS